MQTPVRYSPSVEKLEDDEAKTDKELVDTLRSISETTYENSGRALRSVHAKAHGLLRGELEVLEGLSPILSQDCLQQRAAIPSS